MKSGLSAASPGGFAFPQLTPAIYNKLNAEINAACDEMIQMKVERPTQEILEQMSNRVYENVKKTHPGVVKYAKAYDKSMPGAFTAPVSVGGLSIQWAAGGAFIGLIAFLLLVGFFGRRRFRRRGRRFA